jgi:hypothetical protein
VNTVSESLRDIRQAPATRAYLRRSVGVDLNKLPASVLCFVGELGKERTPRCIVDRTSEHPPGQSLGVQVFHGDKAVAVSQSATELVLKIRPLVEDMSVALLEKTDGLSPAVATFLTPGDLTLNTAKVGEPVLEVAWVGNKLTIREGGEGVQPHIDTDNSGRRNSCRSIDQHRKTGVPLTSLPLEGEGLNLAGDRAMQLKFEDTYPLDFKPTGISKVAAVSPSREGIAVEPVPGLKARVANSLPSLDTAEEGGKGLVNTPEHVLTGGKVSQVKVAGISYLFKLGRLIVVVKTNMLHLPSIAALLNRGIIKRASFVNLVLKGRGLLSRGVEAIFESSTHLLTFLPFDILPDCGLAHIPNGANIVAPGPKTRKLCAKDSELRAENTGRCTLELIDDVLNCFGRLSCNEQVHVVRHNLNRLKVNAKLLSFKVKHFLETVSDVIRKYLFTIFRTPHQVILDVVDATHISFVSLTHTYYYTTVICISQALVLKGGLAHYSAT